MNGILSDASKFSRVLTPMNVVCAKIEDKINRFLRKLLSLELLTEDVYNRLFVSGSSPGVMYGLPKTHKVGVPLRPIFAAYNTAPYKLAKYLVPILSDLTTNQYTVDNSYTFVDQVRKMHGAESYFMVSLDVESLFTNVPLMETISICLESLFSNNIKHVLGLTRKYFKTLLELSVKNSLFIFDGNLYEQVEGLGMGLPLGPTFANIFMCHHETKWLEQCPSEFCPVFYRRYVDDTFVLFHKEEHAESFLSYLNGQHPNIKFTMEKEGNKKLSFLDVCVSKDGNSFVTSVYRKPSHTGLGQSFFDFCPDIFKYNAIATLLHRCFNITSTFEKMHEEIVTLKKFFSDNGFPRKVIDGAVHSFLQKKLGWGEEQETSVAKDKLYCTLPYFGPQSIKLKKELTKSLSKLFPATDFHFVLCNSFKIGSVFRFKDSVPPCARFSVVYKFGCAQCCASYVGSTLRSLKARVSQHMGVSFRTGKYLSRPDQSVIRDHINECNGSHFTIDDFKILDNVQGCTDLRILESIYIHKLKPTLNDHRSAHPLYILH